WNRRVLPKCSSEEIAQVCARAGISHPHRSFRDSVNPLNCAQDAAEVIVAVIDVSLRSVGRNDDQRHPETNLIIGLAIARGAWQSRNLERRLIIRPASPIVPRNDNGGI